MNQQTPPLPKSSKLKWWLAGLFVLSLVMGTGPGVLLVNTPEPLWNFPRVYLWGLFWYAVQVIVVLIAYFTIWTDGDDQQLPAKQNPTKE